MYDMFGKERNTDVKKPKIKNLGSMICNVLALIFVTCAILRFFTDGGDANMKTHGIFCFRYFTNLSNIFAALTCAAALPFNIAALISARRGGDDALHLPQVLYLFKFVGSTAVGVTFFTVVFFLAPLWGRNWWMMFSGNTFWLHLICPLLCLAATIFFEADRRLRLRSALWGVLPTLVYGIVYFLMVIVVGEGNGGWEDFYQFNMGGLWYISAAAMLAGTYLLALCILVLMNRIRIRTEIKNNT